MGIGPLLDARIYAGAVDLSGQSNKVEFSASLDEEDTTVFKPPVEADRGWKTRTGTLLESKIAVSGFWEAGDATKVDDGLFGGLRTRMPWTVVEGSAWATAVGDTALLTQALHSKYKPGFEHGKIAAYEASAVTDWAVARGQVVHPPGTARTATGNGTAVQLGAVAAGQYLYASVHVLSVAGTSTPTITVKVQSDDANGMGSPTDRITFAAATAVGGEIQRLAGPITDSWYRATWTISGTSPSFLFIAAIGIATL